MPAAWTRTRTSCAPACGCSISTTRRTSGPPKAEKLTARISAIAVLCPRRKRRRTLLVIAVTLDRRACGLDLGTFLRREAPREHGEPLGRLHGRGRIAGDDGGPPFRLGPRVVHHSIEQAEAQSFFGRDIAGDEQHFERLRARNNLR